MERVVLERKPDAHVRRLSMAHDVVERLLNDAEYRRRCGHVEFELADIEQGHHLKTVPLLDVVRDPSDRGRQAKIIEQRWAQVRGDATHRTDQGVDSRL